MTIQELINAYPHCYHMAESGTWQSIQQRGLLSTVALLDLFEISGEQRRAIADEHRRESVTITHPMHGTAVIRDQKPMSEPALRTCLDDGLTPTDWFRTLNRKVFFWVSEKRLNRLLAARAYRKKKHCVLTVDTCKLVCANAANIELCPINSGSTIFSPQRRGRRTFLPICDYPFSKWKAKRGTADAVVELTVNYSVPNIRDYTISVEERKGADIIRRLS